MDLAVGLTHSLEKLRRTLSLILLWLREHQGLHLRTLQRIVLLGWGLRELWWVEVVAGHLNIDACFVHNCRLHLFTPFSYFQWILRPFVWNSSMKLVLE